MERGRSRPNLEPVTALPRARGSKFPGFDASAGFASGALGLLGSIGASESVTERTVVLGVPGCGSMLRCFGLTL